MENLLLSVLHHYHAIKIISLPLPLVMPTTQSIYMMLGILIPLCMKTQYLAYLTEAAVKGSNGDHNSMFSQEFQITNSSSTMYAANRSYLRSRQKVRNSQNSSTIISTQISSHLQPEHKRLISMISEIPVSPSCTNKLLISMRIARFQLTGVQIQP